jgi:hypothetical protein
MKPHKGRAESMRIRTVEPIHSLAVGRQEFFLSRSLQELADMQGVRPIKNPGALAGAFLESDNVDEMLEEIYRERR